jgi:hypothetical protein
MAGRLCLRAPECYLEAFEAICPDGGTSTWKLDREFFHVAKFRHLRLEFAAWDSSVSAAHLARILMGENMQRHVLKA